MRGRERELKTRRDGFSAGFVLDDFAKLVALFRRLLDVDSRANTSRLIRGVPPERKYARDFNWRVALIARDTRAERFAN